MFTPPEEEDNCTLLSSEEVEVNEKCREWVNSTSSCDEMFHSFEMKTDREDEQVETDGRDISLDMLHERARNLDMLHERARNLGVTCPGSSLGITIELAGGCGGGHAEEEEPEPTKLEEEYEPISDQTREKDYPPIEETTDFRSSPPASCISDQTREKEYPPIEETPDLRSSPPASCISDDPAGELDDTADNCTEVDEEHTKAELVEYPETLDLCELDEDDMVSPRGISGLTTSDLLGDLNKTPNFVLPAMELFSGLGISKTLKRNRSLDDHSISESGTPETDSGYAASSAPTTPLDMSKTRGKEVMRAVFGIEEHALDVEF